jgi:O-acetyl-ADP-ribose deacetylase (regulator of RNase III)
MITKYIVGDITKTELKYIAHGVNTQNVMGSGVARALYTKFPEVKKEYHEYLQRQLSAGYELSDSLGKMVKVESADKIIFNLFTQEFYGYDGKKYVNYAAIVNSFTQIKNRRYQYQQDSIMKIAIPKIGCGLAGGDWNIVEQLINDTVGDDLEIWVYELEEKKYSKQNGAPT